MQKIMTSSITEYMVNDHDRIVSLFNDFKNSKNKDKKRAAEVFKRFNQELLTHFHTEERVLKLAFGKDKEKRLQNQIPIANSLKLEHGQIMEKLENIAHSIRNDKVIHTSDLFLILNRHKNVEERLFYPEIDNILTEKEKNFIIENISDSKGG